VRIGLGDDTALPYQGAQSLAIEQSVFPVTSLCTDPSCLMQGTPLPVNPFTGQPSSTLATLQNTLSGNSSWIIPAVAIGGLFLALMGKKR